MLLSDFVKFFLTVALLAFAGQIAAWENVVPSHISADAEHTIRNGAQVAPPVFVIFASEGASFLPIADSQGSPRTIAPPLSGEVSENSEPSFDVRIAGIISGLSPPLA